MFTAPDNPQKATRDLIEHCRVVLEKFHPLGCRAIYYRLADGKVLPKAKAKADADAMTNRIERAIKIGRALGLIPFDWIVDHGRESTRWHEQDDDPQWVDESIRQLCPTPWWTQPVYLELFVEAQGLKAHFDEVCGDYNVMVSYGRGNSSWTLLHDIAERIAQRTEKFGKDAVILTFGDLNPAGDNIHDCVVEAMDQWCDELVDVRRVCLLPEDVERYALPTYQPKAGDAKAHNWLGDVCAELESMGDDQIPERIHEEIRKVLDIPALEKLRRKQKRLQAKAHKLLAVFR